MQTKIDKKYKASIQKLSSLFNQRRLWTWKLKPFFAPSGGWQLSNTFLALCRQVEDLGLPAPCVRLWFVMHTSCFFLCQTATTCFLLGPVLIRNTRARLSSPILTAVTAHLLHPNSQD